MCETESDGAHEAETAVAGRGRVTIVVPDMTCGHCVGTVRAAIAQLLPNADVAIDLDTHRVTVAGDAEVAATAIRSAGYTPKLVPA